MFDFVFSKPIIATTIINYLALFLFIIETFMIIILKLRRINSFPEWKYLDFFLRNNLLTTVLLRIILFLLSLVVFLPDMFVTYRLFSVIYLSYVIVFAITCGWIYAYFKGYTKNTK